MRECESNKNNIVEINLLVWFKRNKNNIVKVNLLVWMFSLCPTTCLLDVFFAFFLGGAFLLHTPTDNSLGHNTLFHSMGKCTANKVLKAITLLGCSLGLR